MKAPCCEYIALIPVDKIDVPNPRERNKTVFQDVQDSVHTVGLKKPIKVTPRTAPDGEQRYRLVFGEGRLITFKAAGETYIPALVVQATDEDAFLMSLVENIARRTYKPMELLSGIKALQTKGYDKHEIAKKIGMSADRVQGILTLINRGEEQLLHAVESGSVPLSAALIIVGAGDASKDTQAVLKELYDTGQLRGKQLYAARRIAASREKQRRDAAVPKPPQKQITAAHLVRSYQQEVERQKTMIRKSHSAQDQLLFVLTAFRQLKADTAFMDLLRAHGLGNAPKYLTDRLMEGESS